MESALILLCYKGYTHFLLKSFSFQAVIIYIFFLGNYDDLKGSPLYQFLMAPVSILQTRWLKITNLISSPLIPFVLLLSPPINYSSSFSSSRIETTVLYFILIHH